MKEKELLASVRHIALATVNEDGTPHNTPLFFAFDSGLNNLYFVSRAESLHTKNFLRTGKAFAVIYDSNEFNGGLYLTIENGRMLEGKELSNAHEIYMARCKTFDIDVLPENFHLQDGGYNLYAGDIVKIETYSSEEDAAGKLKVENRLQISSEVLISLKHKNREAEAENF